MGYFDLFNLQSYMAVFSELSDSELVSDFDDGEFDLFEDEDGELDLSDFPCDGTMVLLSLR